MQDTRARTKRLKSSNSITGVTGLNVRVHHGAYGRRLYACASYDDNGQKKERCRSLHEHGVSRAAQQLARTLRHRHENYDVEELVPIVEDGIKRGVKRIAKSGSFGRNDDEDKRVAQRFVNLHFSENGYARTFVRAVKDGQSIVKVIRTDGTAHSIGSGDIETDLTEWQSRILESALDGNDNRRLWVGIWADHHGIEVVDEGPDRNYERLLDLFRRDEKVKPILDFINLYTT